MPMAQYVYLRVLPIRVYRTAERALNKDKTLSFLYYRRGTFNLEPFNTYNPTNVYDERGIVYHIQYAGQKIGWVRKDEINMPIDMVPTKYHMVIRGDTPNSVMAMYGITRHEFETWNPNLVSKYSLWGEEGKYLIVGMATIEEAEENPEIIEEAEQLPPIVGNIQIGDEAFDIREGQNILDFDFSPGVHEAIITYNGTLEFSWDTEVMG